MSNGDPNNTFHRSEEMQASKDKVKILEVATSFYSKLVSAMIWCKAKLSEWPIHMFSLEAYFDRYEREMNARRYRALENLKTGSWDTFIALLTSQLDQIRDSQWFRGRYRVDHVDLREEFDKVVKLHLERKESPFLSSIKGTSLKSISIYEVTSPVFGVGKFEYSRGEKLSKGLYSLEGAALTFSQTVTGGLFVYFAYPKSEGLLGNENDGLAYRLFDDISKITAQDLDKSLRFFFRFNNEMSLYGKPSFGGRFYLWWIKRKNAGSLWDGWISLLSAVVMRSLKLQAEDSSDDN